MKIAEIREIPSRSWQREYRLRMANYKQMKLNHSILHLENTAQIKDATQYDSSYEDCITPERTR
jgi:hypothetical protein